MMISRAHISHMWGMIVAKASPCTEWQKGPASKAYREALAAVEA